MGMAFRAIGFLVVLQDSLCLNLDRCSNLILCFHTPPSGLLCKKPQNKQGAVSLSKSPKNISALDLHKSKNHSSLLWRFNESPKQSNPANLKGI